MLDTERSKEWSSRIQWKEIKGEFSARRENHGPPRLPSFHIQKIRIFSSEDCNQLDGRNSKNYWGQNNR